VNFGERLELIDALALAALIGDAVTVNSLLDAQWHLLCVIGLLPAGLVWWQDRHVRVDVLWQRMVRVGRMRIELIGHIALTLPFLLLSIPPAWQFALRAWRNGEASTSGGLNDLFLVKGILPLGLALLGLFVLADMVRWARRRSSS
jgi:TRAP-type mannitol/chloroaromatic compound transport system permease small subunit